MTARYYAEYLEKQGLESWDSRVVHLLLERQYEVNKRVIQAASESATTPATVKGLDRENLLDHASKVVLSQVNALPLPEIRNILEMDPSLQLRQVAPSSAVPALAPTAPTAMDKRPQIISEDLGPSDATQFAKQPHTRDLASSAKRARTTTAASDQ
ncbi:hypothetical protein BASA81_005809 [Batrachochytrium salamandrivorans]|nr:hypothetical protein BASA81_005809 [Batrachochytrium salamandrivorans]